MGKHHTPAIYEKNKRITALAIDSHAHLDRDLDTGRIIAQMEQDGLKKIVIMAGNIETAKWASNFCKENKNVFYMFGLHPYDIDNYNQDFVDNLTKFGKEKNWEIHVMHEDIFNLMHKI